MSNYNARSWRVLYKMYQQQASSQSKCKHWKSRLGTLIFTLKESESKSGNTAENNRKISKEHVDTDTHMSTGHYTT